MADTTTSPSRINGRVALILNARELVINVGSDHGARAGMKFAVLSEQPLEIRDPETQEVLDTVDREKVRVEATEVRPKVTICRTYRTKVIPAGPYHAPISSILNIRELARPPQEVPETLEARDSSLPPPLGPDESYVKVNDRVIEVAV